MTAALPKPNPNASQIRSKPDRRRHQRVDLRLNGRFMLDGHDHSFLTRDVSCGGAALEARAVPEVGASVVCYFDDLGRVTAEVVREINDGFAVSFNTPKFKRDKLADRRVWLVNKNKYDLKDVRAARRKAAGGPALVTRENGTKLQCRVIDISLTGAAFEFDGPVPIVGERVRVGSLRGEVVRAITGEFAIRFLHKNKD